MKKLILKTVKSFQMFFTNSIIVRAGVGVASEYQNNLNNWFFNFVRFNLKLCLYILNSLSDKPSSFLFWHEISTCSISRNKSISSLDDAAKSKQKIPLHGLLFLPNVLRRQKYQFVKANFDVRGKNLWKAFRCSLQRAY